MKFLAKTSFLSLMLFEALQGAGVTGSVSLTGNAGMISVYGTTGLVTIPTQNKANLFDLTTGQIVGTTTFTSSPNGGAALWGSLALCGFTGSPYLRVFNTDTQAQYNLSAISSPISSAGLCLSGTTAYQITRGVNLESYDVSLPNSSRIALGTFSDPCAVAADFQRVLVTGYNGTVYNGSPIFINPGSSFSVGSSSGIALSGSVGIVVDFRTSKAKTFNVFSNEILGVLDISYPLGVAASGRYAAIASNDRGISIIDLYTSTLKESFFLDQPPQIVALNGTVGVASRSNSRFLSIFSFGPYPEVLWTGLAGDNSWNNPLNWSPNTVPNSSLDAGFNGSASNIILGNASANSLNFYSGASSFVFSSGTLTVFSEINANGTQTFNAPVICTGNSINNAGNLFINANLTGFGAPLALNGLGTLYNGSQSQLSSSIGITASTRIFNDGTVYLTSLASPAATITGSGTLILSGTNTPQALISQGQINVLSGTLTANQTLLAPVFIGSTSFITGTGTLLSLNVSGKVSPGQFGLGTLSVITNTNLGTSSTFQIAPYGQNLASLKTQSLSIEGSVSLNVERPIVGMPSSTFTKTLIEANSRSGTFSTINFPAGVTYNVIYSGGNVLMQGTVPATSSTATWTGSVSSSWFNSSNWENNTSPNSLSTAVFPGSITSVVQINNNEAFAAGLNFDGTTSLNGLGRVLNLYPYWGNGVNVNGSTIIQDLQVNINTDTDFNINSSLNNSRSEFVFTNDPFSTKIQGSGSLINDGMIGWLQSYATGSISIMGGSITNSGYIGLAQNESRMNLSIISGDFFNDTQGSSSLGVFYSGSRGTVSINGGQFVNYYDLAYALSSGPVAFIISGGSFTNAIDFCDIAYLQRGSQGIISITGGQFYNQGYLAIFDNSSGTATITGGTFSNSYNTLVMLGTAQANLTIAGGEFSNSSTGSLGCMLNSSQGRLFLQGGTIFSQGFVAQARNNSTLSFVQTGGLISSQGTANSGIFYPSHVGSLVDAACGDISYQGGAITSFDYLSQMTNDARGSITVSGTSAIVNKGYMASLFGSYRGAGSVSFVGGTAMGTITVSGGSITNTGTIAAISGNSKGYLKITGGTLTSQSGLIGLGLQTFEMSSGKMSLINSRLAPFTVNSMTISSSANITADSSSIIGPCELQMTGGNLQNAGLLLLDKVIHSGDLLAGSYSRQSSNSFVSSGTISGNGQLWIAGTCVLSGPLTQSKIVIGQAGLVTDASFSPNPQAASSVVFSSDRLSGDVVVTGSGSLFAKGTITGSVTCAGNFSPGIAATSRGILNVGSGVSLVDRSNFFAVLDGAASNRMVTSGTLSLGGSTSLVITKTTAPITGNKTYTIAQAPTISGFFGTVIDVSGLGNALSVVYNPTSIQLKIAGSSTPVIPTGNPNAASVIRTLIAINGNCPQQTQNIIDYLFSLPPGPLEADAAELAPAMKTIQFSLEKLDLLIHKELESELYSEKKGTIPFIIAGYDNLDQGVKYPYNGYSVDSFYQLFGVTHDWVGANWMGMIGASESYMAVRPQPARASYNTVWASLGASGRHRGWFYGLDTLFGYAFTKSHRDISFLNGKAYTSHGAWNISFDGKIGYQFKTNIIDSLIYDDVSYIYGEENAYTESGAPGANLYVKDETISQIRNMLGICFETKKGHHVNLFVDGSWVYEHYFNSNIYSAAFDGTDVFGPYQQQEPTQNYGRIQTGLKGDSNHLGWKLAYTGLFGKRFSESSASLKFSYKF